MIDKTKANFNVFTCESYIQLDIKLNIILKILRKILSFKVGVQRATVAFALFPLLYNSSMVKHNHKHKNKMTLSLLCDLT